jgi:hypothetical protein
MAHILQTFSYISGARTMNNLPNFKIEKICSKLAEIDAAISKKFTSPDNPSIRILIDRRRHLLALLNREVAASINQHHTLSSFAYKSQSEVVRFIDVWCNQIKTFKPQNISFDCPDFCDLLIDHILPKSWNFDDDLMIIHQPQSSTILNAALTRNQKNIIIYNEIDSLPHEINSLSIKNSIHICNSVENLERTVSLLQIPAQQVISFSCTTHSTASTDAKTAITKAVNAGKRTRTENTATASKFGQSWCLNVIKNIDKIQYSKNLHQLKISGVEDAVIVASGPSLTKNIAKLREVQNSVFTVAALRSLPVLKAAGIEADLVIQLDAEDSDVALKVSAGKLHPVKNLLLEGTVDNGFFSIPAQNIIWSLPQHFFDIHQKFGTKPTPFNVPSVSIYALSLCQFLNFKNICFIGQDLAASSDKQYADGATDLLPAHTDISMFQLEVPGFFGGTVLTRNSYQYQIKRCSEIANEWESRRLDMNLVNATEGGAYIPGFDHMTLETFIEKQQLKTKQTCKSINFSENFPITAEGADCYLRSIRDTMSKISKLASKIIKIDNQPEKNFGSIKKLEKTIQRFQELNNSTSLLQIAMQENIANVIGTSRKIETVDSYAQFFEKIRNKASLLHTAAKR